MGKRVISQFMGPPVVIPRAAADRYNEAVARWARERGLPTPDELIAGTPTVCSVASAVTGRGDSDSSGLSSADQAHDDMSIANES